MSDYLHRLDDKEEYLGEDWECPHCGQDLRLGPSAAEDMIELLDALQNLHSRNARYDRARRIELLIKHGRIQAPEESNE